ncbi:hypothetical protein Rvan_2413 [Rhodomicrobium vannielii ATCC 17100]|jgi:hypothetical protein|uniref:Uncharacterized protein n=1 Tax=Rhodomicrobium vannielii (strain ATCC 17100 / DSM 162 / LMG 4299 / NCIMB 10020 / ATH 3.1.1) TaxID=648757 RepID=E3I5B6_RHOVT|nr:hypothetical protein Rvan_2413 [Rhodomicrobium vannielii ATCC 17100]
MLGAVFVLHQTCAFTAAFCDRDANTQQSQTQTRLMVHAKPGHNLKLRSG